MMKVLVQNEFNIWSKRKRERKKIATDIVNGKKRMRRDTWRVLMIIQNA